MRKSWILLSTLAVLLVPRVWAAAPAEYVLVWKNACLHQGPDAKSPRVRELAFSDKERPERLEQVRVFRLVAWQGDWVQIETMQDSNYEHCMAPLYDLADYRLNLFVRKQDVVLVLREEVREQYADGTSLRLRPGLPLLFNQSDKRYRVAHAGLALAAKFSADKVAKSYRPAGRLVFGCEHKWDASRSRLRFAKGRKVRLNSNHAACVEVARREKGSSLWRLRTACVDMQVKADPPPQVIEGPGRGALAGLFGAMNKGDWLKVGRGATVYWADGRQAGKARADLWFEIKSVKKGDLTCVEKTLLAGVKDLAAPETERKMRLCFRSEDMMKAKRPNPFEGLGVAGVKGVGLAPTGRKTGEVRISEAPPKVKGFLSKDIIQRVIRKHINRIKFCYEKALLKRVDLKGKVMVRFVVGGKGKVISASLSSSTLGDKNTEACILTVVRAMVFPKPKGGGLVIVNYPFVFKSEN
ncbi:MAG: TonB family protein [Deltaproteobacteria bacterium]|nr:TonB family protein [Deltaproteobacteria bacterium]